MTLFLQISQTLPLTDQANTSDTVYVDDVDEAVKILLQEVDMYMNIPHLHILLAILYTTVSYKNLIMNNSIHCRILIYK